MPTILRIKKKIANWVTIIYLMHETFFVKWIGLLRNKLFSFSNCAVFCTLLYVHSVDKLSCNDNVPLSLRKSLMGRPIGSFFVLRRAFACPQNRRETLKNNPIYSTTCTSVLYGNLLQSVSHRSEERTNGNLSFDRCV